MDDYRAVAADFLTVIPAFYPVIRAKAGIQRVADEIDAARILACDSRERVMSARASCWLLAGGAWRRMAHPLAADAS